MYMPDNNDLQQELKVDLGNAINKDVKVHYNLGQDIIITTSDKIRLTLGEVLEKMNKRKEWIAPLGIFLSLLLAICTTTFKEAYGVEADQWFAFFFVGTIISFVWLLWALYVFYKCKNVNVQSVIDLLKLK
jgi:hypothetical protein